MAQHSNANAQADSMLAEMTARDLIPVLQIHFDQNRNAMIWGMPGLGKSQIIAQLAANNNCPIIDLRAPTMDALDLRGLPYVERTKIDGMTKESAVALFAQCGLLPIESRDGPVGILFLDELPGGDQMIQKALLELTEDRRCGDYRLPPGWRIFAAGNRLSDKAGVGRFNTALADRFSHYGLAPDADSWIAYAIPAGISAETCAFIRFRPELLCVFDPDSLVNASPRSWEVADRMTAGQKLPPEIESRIVAARVGLGPAAEYMGFLQIWRQLPNPDSVLSDPHGSPVPDSPGALYAICGALARKVTPATADSFVQYIARLPAPEFGVMAIRDAEKRTPALAATRAVIGWKAANSDLYT